MQAFPIRMAVLLGDLNNKWDNELKTKRKLGNTENIPQYYNFTSNYP